jgi:hypothetical protein
MTLALEAGTSLSTSPEPGSEHSYESRDKQRMLTALYELRSYCKTDKARISFEVFEHQLRREWARSGLANPMDVSLSPSQHLGSQSKTRAHQVVARSKDSQNTQLVARSILPSTIDRMKPQIPLPNIWGRLTLTKSKTTGNLESLKTNKEPIVQPKLSGQAASIYNRRKAPAQFVDSSDNPAVKDMGQKDSLTQRLRPPRAHMAHKRQASNATINSSVSTNAGFISESEHVNRPPLCHCRTASRSVDRFDELLPGVSVSSIESGHRPAPPPPPTSIAPPHSPLSPRSILTVSDHEKLIKSRRGEHRRSSGEALKGMWSAGVEHVRKMGRRVGGSESWLISSDH